MGLFRGAPIHQETRSVHRQGKGDRVIRLIYIDEAEARRRINNPREQTKLHYDVVSYIERRYPNVLIRLGLGENQITHFSIMYSKKRDT